MNFKVAFHDNEALREAGRQPVRSRWPHLRLVPLVPLEAFANELDELPAHVAKIVQMSPDPAVLASIDCVLGSNLATTAATYPHVPRQRLISWGSVPGAYDTWMRDHYLPFQRTFIPYNPEGLKPIGAAGEQVSLEIVGGCSADFLLRYTDELALDLDLDIDASVITHNHPVPVTRGPSGPPDVQLVVPPLRFMHPATVDDFIVWSDHELRLGESVTHLYSYLDQVVAGLPATHRFVAGFMEPFANPIGFDNDRTAPSNFKIFVRRLNDALAAWCDDQPSTWFVDANEISAVVGRARSDEELLQNLAHRTAMDPFDDWLELDEPLSPYSAFDSYDMRATGIYHISVLRHVFSRRTTILGRDQVKLVITDLDNTLWRGLLSDGHIGSWRGRPAGIAEALRVVRRRGILLAIASKNDPSLVQERWQDALGPLSDDALGMSLGLDEFVMAKIGFDAKSRSVAEILQATNIDALNAVFIDDNPLEREEVQAAFPDMRILGAELNYVRRELLYSPYTQRHVLTDEDAARTESTRARIKFHQTTDGGKGGGDYLAALQLRLSMALCTDASSQMGQRCLQLLNKTNQWHLNGDRLDEKTFEDVVDAGKELLVYGSVEDATTSHGIVAVAMVDPARKELRHMAVSCRVMGMGIDEAFASQLLEAFGPLTLNAAVTERNSAAQLFKSRHCSDGSCLSTCPKPEHVELKETITAPAHAFSSAN